jgi:hypothetical protein
VKARGGDYEHDGESGMLLPRHSLRGGPRSHPQYLGPAFFSSAPAAGDTFYSYRTLIVNLTTTGVSDKSSYADPFLSAVPSSGGGQPTIDSTVGIQLNGSTQYMDTEDQNRWQFGSDFGIEFKGVIATAVNRTQYLVCQRSGGHPIWVLLIKNPGAIEFFSSLGDGTVVTQISSASSAISAGVSFDLAIKRASGTCSMWINQTNVSATGTNNTTSYPNSSDRLSFFTQQIDTGVRFGGSVKGIRLTNGYSPDMSTMSYPFPTS